MDKPTWKERFSYWFDSRMSKGSMSLIRLLIVFTLVLVFVMTGLILLFGFNGEEEAGGVIWDSFATVINAWMPSWEDGSPGYLIFMAVIALGGLLVTSVLIGIIASAIEEKIVGLRKGNSPVIESGHTIVLGFYDGEYTLLHQLILAAGKEKAVIVIGAAMARDDLEQIIDDNFDVPKNVKIICRTIDLFDPADIEKLSPETCKTIIISPTNDYDTVKMLLAVSTLIIDSANRKVRVNAIISKEENRFPPSIARKHNVNALQTNDTLAKIIAHSCTQSGLSEVFTEIFNFEGSELYLISCEEAAGITFSELMVRMDQAVPVGIYRNYEIKINPPADTVIEEKDRILVFADDKHSAEFRKEAQYLPEDYPLRPVKPERDTKVLIFGHNSSLKTVLKELPENVMKAVIVNYEGNDQGRIERICKLREIETEYINADIRTELGLLAIVRNEEHIIILSSHDDEEEKADMDTVFLLLNLRDLRSRFHLRYNITVEMRKEKNQSLVITDDHTDFVVGSNMSALFLAQLAESPELISAFREILSNEGNELYMKQASHLNCAGEHTVSELRQIAQRQGYIFLGCKPRNESCIFNPGLDETLTIANTDSVIVFGES